MQFRCLKISDPLTAAEKYGIPPIYGAIIWYQIVDKCGSPLAETRGISTSAIETGAVDIRKFRFHCGTPSFDGIP